MSRPGAFLRSNLIEILQPLQGLPARQQTVEVLHQLDLDAGWRLPGADGPLAWARPRC